MPPLSSCTIAWIAGLAAFAAWAALPARRAVRAAVVLAVVAASWPLLVRAVLRENDEHNQAVEARAFRGERVEVDEMLADGVGDNVAALLFGWLPAAVGATLALPVDFVFSRRRARNPPLPRAGSEGRGEGDEPRTGERHSSHREPSS